MSQVDVDALRQTVRQILHEGHDAMREIVADLDGDALGWRPGRDTNSIAVLVAHSLDAERFLVATAADVEIERDREAQFRIEVARPDLLLALIDQQEPAIDALLDRVTAANLTAGISRPGPTHAGAWWLLHALEHTREHVGQAALTRQLYGQRS